MPKSIKESRVVNLLRAHLVHKGWTLTNLPKGIGAHGCDVKAWHPQRRRILLVEAKGDGKRMDQTKHNSFYMLLGQILSRMNIQGNDSNKGRIYAIAIPAHWEKMFKDKIIGRNGKQGMAYGWKLLKLKVFLVAENEIQEKSYSYFLK